MNTLLSRPPKVEIDFTDAQLTGFGGWSVLGQMEERLGLPRALSSVSVKRRARGASDVETLWSLIASLAAGNGALSDLDALREDRVGQRLLGLGHVPSGRRLGEYPLAHHRLHIVHNTVRRATVRKTSRKPIHKACRPQKQRTRVRGHRPAAEIRHNIAALQPCKSHRGRVTLCQHRGSPLQMSNSLS